MIEVKITEGKSINKYPFIGVTKEGLTVLFYKFSIGVVLASGTDDIYKVCHYSEIWSMGDFRPLEGQITLSNK